MNYDVNPFTEDDGRTYVRIGDTVPHDSQDRGYKMTDATWAKVNLGLTYMSQDGLTFETTDEETNPVLQIPLGELTEEQGLELHGIMMQRLRDYIDNYKPPVAPLTFPDHAVFPLCDAHFKCDE